MKKFRASFSHIQLATRMSHERSEFATQSTRNMDVAFARQVLQSKTCSTKSHGGDFVLGGGVWQSTSL